ncbi:hypothetical protein D3C81_1059490 [compost metagenome]
MGGTQRVSRISEIVWHGANRLFRYPSQHGQVEECQANRPAKDREADPEIFRENRQAQHAEDNRRHGGQRFHANAQHFCKPIVRCVFRHINARADANWNRDHQREEEDVKGVEQHRTDAAAGIDLLRQLEQKPP